MDTHAESFERLGRSPLYETARRHYVWPLLSRADVASAFPLILTRGAGVRVTDVDNNEYIDLTSGGSRSSTLGYGDQRMVEAIASQLATLHYGGSGPLQADVAIRLAERLAELAPSGLTSTVFTGSGSEANEAAVKVARLYQRENGKPRAFKVISRWNDFHGSSGGAQEASDWLGVRKPSEPGPIGFSRIPGPTTGRCALNCSPCDLRCADFLADHIEHEGPELVSAVLIESVAQANGLQVPPDRYMTRIREICDHYQVLLIVDEVITGFGRTGRWFGVDHWSVAPDIVTTGKAITAGYIPLSATLIRQEIRDALRTFPDVHTFAGHAAGAVAALTAIEIYEKDALVERVADLGNELGDLLGGISNIDSVSDVRTFGLWAAIEFSDGSDHRPRVAPDVIRSILLRARELGIIVNQNGRSIELAPPYVISHEDLREGVERLMTAVRDHV